MQYLLQQLLDLLQLPFWNLIIPLKKYRKVQFQFSCENYQERLTHLKRSLPSYANTIQQLNAFKAGLPSAIKIVKRKIAEFQVGQPQFELYLGTDNYAQQKREYEEALKLLKQAAAQ